MTNILKDVLDYITTHHKESAVISFVSSCIGSILTIMQPFISLNITSYHLPPIIMESLQATSWFVAISVGSITIYSTLLKNKARYNRRKKLDQYNKEKYGE